MTYGFVIKNGNYFIGIDSASGGYPFETISLSLAEIFLTQEKVLQFYKLFAKKEYELYEVSISEILLPWEIDEQEYKEYKRLKEKYEK